MHAYDVMNSESSLEMSTSLQQAILSIELYLNIEQKLMVSYLDQENPPFSPIDNPPNIQLYFS